MDIYLDVLFLENIVMNYLILVMTARFSKIKTSNVRLLLGALIGAAYVVVLVLFPDMEVYYTTVAKIALSLGLVAIVFSPERIKDFIKVLAIFYISTFIFAGAALAFLYFFESGGIIKNGILYVYWQSKWTLLFLSIITVVIIIRTFWDVIQYKFIREKLLIPLKIIFESRRIHLSALVDTGNNLHDPLTNMPVVIVEFAAIREILPQDIRSIFDQSQDQDLTYVTTIISRSNWYSRFRLIPYTSLGRENGMLIGFKPDYIEIGDEDEKRGVSDVIIGIYNRALSKNEHYKALLGPELVG